MTDTNIRYDVRLPSVVLRISSYVSHNSPASPRSTKNFNQEFANFSKYIVGSKSTLITVNRTKVVKFKILKINLFQEKTN